MTRGEAPRVPQLQNQPLSLGDLGPFAMAYGNYGGYGGGGYSTDSTPTTPTPGGQSTDSTPTAPTPGGESAPPPAPNRGDVFPTGGITPDDFGTVIQDTHVPDSSSGSNSGSGQGGQGGY